MDFDSDDSLLDADYVPSEKELNIDIDNSENTAKEVTTSKEKNNGCNLHDTNQQDSNKKVRNPQRRVAEWKCNVRKRRHEKGEEYISVRNKLVPAKRLKTTKNCGNRIEVCKQFFCGTLSISQKPVYTAHKNPITIIPKKSRQSKFVKHKISEADRQNVKNHINSFLRIPSHYCRSTSDREYLESGLKVTKMHDLYLTKMQELGQDTVTQSAYRHIFLNEFNLHFFKPKKDRCGLCEEVQLLKNEAKLSDEKQASYESHILEKTIMREERQKDRVDNHKAVLCFDLQNVLQCPKAEIGQFYYKTKFSVYNLAAHFSINKKVYCAFWTESTMERKGTDIASALSKIIEEVIIRKLPN
ncbi:hypothetical protein ILUMI_02348 [Ignelater luminosus]|uniref:Uncharacterized protein n=1 Tax=Ignelater luminosus TaxID=2038154 RepID=A0A8K0DHT8_IGNLU|nr:hypothetical protein ILUMI_02348 [Ignelater luminosus]